LSKRTGFSFGVVIGYNDT